jgi:hydroxymethylbilane synthase
MRIRIATRRSKLALTQTRWVGEHLRALEPSLEVELLEMVTQGDRIQDRPLSEVGGKGLFVSELEQAILEGRAEMAVHSLKDLPADLAPGLSIACVPEREDARDVLITTDGVEIDALTAGENVGTSSLRRSLQLSAFRNDLAFEPLRGNVDTRLSKLESGQYRAIVLAYSGLRRLGLADRPLWPLPPSVCLPAVGQGALAVECREDAAELRALLARLEHAPTRCCVEAERAFLSALGGDCHTPLAAHARLDEAGRRLRFDGLVCGVQDRRMVRGSTDRYIDVTGEALLSLSRTLGRETAETLLDQGAAQLIRDASAEAAARLRDPRARPN